MTLHQANSVWLRKAALHAGLAIALGVLAGVVAWGFIEPRDRFAPSAGESLRDAPPDGSLLIPNYDPTNGSDSSGGVYRVAPDPPRSRKFPAYPIV